MNRTEALLDEIRREFPRFRIVRKTESPWQRVIGTLLRIVTLGGQREYVSRYRSVIGRTLYLPASWDELSDDDRYLALRHERVHLRQFRRLGPVGMALLYLLPILPIGLAIGRARLEWEAYRETIRATAEVRGIEAAGKTREWIVRRFTGPAYGWMWPFPAAVRRWIDRALDEVGAEIGADAARSGDGREGEARQGG